MTIANVKNAQTSDCAWKRATTMAVRILVVSVDKTICSPAGTHAKMNMGHVLFTLLMHQAPRTVGVSILEQFHMEDKLTL